MLGDEAHAQLSQAVSPSCFSAELGVVLLGLQVRGADELAHCARVSAAEPDGEFRISPRLRELVGTLEFDQDQWWAFGDAVAQRSHRGLHLFATLPDGLVELLAAARCLFVVA
ncbi:hypothetical protein A6A25_40940 [Saccharothrix sp. CB00851]|nr:hypothetical protein A6A25_40940 [Saccharothrix sp. CB00851]